MSYAVPTRAEITEADKWDLTQLFADVSKWKEDFTWLQREYPKLEQWKGRVGESAQSLAAVLEFEKALELKMERVHHYASLQLAEDSTNNEYLARIGQLQNLLTNIGEAAAFVVPEILTIDDKTFSQFMADPALKDWRIKLHKIRRMKPHVLSFPEERILALGSVALSGYDDTFSQLTDVDMKFGALMDETGREKPLTQSSFSSFLVKRDPELRKRAFHQFYAEFQDHQYTLASSLAYSAKADVFHARARHYSSALEAALFLDDVPVSVYDGLIKSVRANLEPLFRYFDLRRRALGLRELHLYDTYVPLVPEIETRFTFDQAAETVLSALAPLGKNYVDVLAEGLRSRRWCDRYENKGKRSGAFSSVSYGALPYILMNYNEDVFTDIYTLAHEAGHSMHSWFSQNSQLFQDYEYPIFLAEVASTFNEELLTQHLLQTTRDPKMRAYIVNRQIDELRGTLFRQTMFAEFEKIIHAIEEIGDALTLDVFKSEYHKLLETYFAENFVLDPELNLECLRIPHFYHAFYVYKYATGISAAVALSQRVLSGESESVDAYLNFLRSGGSRFPLETLKAAGVDMATPAPIESTLRLFEQRLAELEELLL
ncbi:MAG: oligoendopeptidase F [Verrucomicrobia bacterium]|nr:MAG: oligoendopeptidase F [Verrucomicrobiota bacterium]